MSYDICYDRVFIRSGMGITPMWLVGSNNCTETVWGLDGKCHERRERHWSPLCNMAGGYLGAGLAISKGSRITRPVIILVLGLLLLRVFGIL